MQYCVKHIWPMTEKEVDEKNFCDHVGLYVNVKKPTQVNGYCFCPEKMEQCEKEKVNVR